MSRCWTSTLREEVLEEVGRWVRLEVVAVEEVKAVEGRLAAVLHWWGPPRGRMQWAPVVPSSNWRKRPSPLQRLNHISYRRCAQPSGVVAPSLAVYYHSRTGRKNKHNVT